MVTVDVLIPHYNDIDGLSMSLQSVAAQDWHGRFRVVIYDDGSRPETVARLADVVDTFSSDKLRIELVLGEINKGRPAARNALMDSIGSEYVTWLDAGDEWYPAKTRMQMLAVYRAKALYGNQHFWVTCDYDWKWIGGRKRHVRQNVNQDQVTALLLGKDLRAYLWTLLAPAEAFKWVGRFDESLPRLQDLDFFLRFAVQGGKFVGVMEDRPLCIYHKSDIGRDAAQIRGCFYYIYNKFGFVYQSMSGRFRKNRRYEIEFHAARFAKNNGENLKVVWYLLRAFIERPYYLGKKLVTGRLGL